MANLRRRVEQPGMLVELEGDRIFVRFNHRNGAAEIAAEEVLLAGGFTRYRQRWTRLDRPGARDVAHRAEAAYKSEAEG